MARTPSVTTTIHEANRQIAYSSDNPKVVMWSLYAVTFTIVFPFCYNAKQ
ncbi:MAG: hypothetical protein NVSMB33_17230 [Ktedonobacteraceae bacterium]